MTNSAQFSQKKPIFHGKQAPEDGVIVGYAAIADTLKLHIPIPSPISLISERNKQYHTDDWKVFPKSYLPDDNREHDEITALYKHLVFALKYEGINLLFFSYLTKHYSTKQLTKLVRIEPTGQYSRRIWFLIEWITGKKLKGKNSLNKKSYIPLVDETKQFAIKGIKSPRHLVINNLPGTPLFCPMIRKTEKLDNYIEAKLSNQKNSYLSGIRKDLVQRASAFLLLKDSKASFSIEGESPKNKRAARWGQIIGQAGTENLTKNEIIRLQQIVIENSRFVEMGYRTKGGFVGEHDRITGEPIPDHISAKWQDVDLLMEGLLQTNDVLLKSNLDAVIASSLTSFGFVFIHPLEDGNGRIHRYLIHHMLARKGFSQQGMIFPVSASIIDHIADYKNVLEDFSRNILEFIDWKETDNHNIEVTNNTIDYYRYYDATAQAEFLYDCVHDTIANIIPEEISYLTKFEEFKKTLDNVFEMPDKTVALLVMFLGQNNGVLSKRAIEKEFTNISHDEITFIEDLYTQLFGG